MQKRVLVTGGAGYVGSVLVPELLARGYRVRVLDKFVFGEESIAGFKDQIEIVKCDIRTPPPDLMEGVWAVIHLAGLSTEATSYYSPRYTDKVNHLGTEIIAKMAKASNVERFVFASSCSVYFTYDTPLVPPLYNEDEKINTISPYSISKRTVEEAVFELNDQHFRPTILRKATVYGFSPRMRYDLVLNAFTKDAFRKRQIVVHAGGEMYRPLVDIRDVAQAYAAALELPLERIGGKIYNVVGENWKIGEIANIFREMIGVQRGVSVEVEVQPVGMGRSYRADPARFNADFRLTPTRTVEEAILEMWEKLQRGHDFTNQLFYNDYWQIELMKSGKIELT